MLNKVLATINRYSMLRDVQEVAVALSGGADSVCLLYVLLELRQKFGYSLSAIHINHQLRGDESDRDERFVRALCKSLDVPLVVERAEVSLLAESQGKSIELAARDLRYEVFARCCKGVVATAHSADDNLETVIYNMTRGSGLKGICGIPPKRDIFIRPLIACTRIEIEDYLKNARLDFVTDSTNLSDEYTRNKLRHRVVPVLKEINCAVPQKVYDMCENLREDEDFLAMTARKIYILCLKNGELDAELLKIQHSAIAKRVILYYFEEALGRSLDRLHLNLCYSVLSEGGRTEITRDLFACCYGGKFYVVDEKEGREDALSVTAEDLLITDEEKVNKKFLKNAIDCDKIVGSLVFRYRKESDSIRVNGRHCTKTLKKLFNEQKIPAHKRDSIPVVVDDVGVVWVYGIGADERVAVDSDTKKAKIFSVKRIYNHGNSGEVEYDR